LPHFRYFQNRCHSNTLTGTGGLVERALETWQRLLACRGSYCYQENMTTGKASRFWITFSLCAGLMFGAMPLSALAKSDPGKGATHLNRFGTKKSPQKSKATKSGTGRAKKGVHPPHRKK
jgi:hypothetical protein